MTDHSPDHAERAERSLPMQESEVQVIQADREAAALLAAKFERQRGSTSRRMREGQLDLFAEVQAFARHRQQAEDAMRERCAVIADEAEAMRIALFEENEASINAHKAVQAADIATAIRAATISKEGE